MVTIHYHAPHSHAPSRAHLRRLGHLHAGCTRVALPSLALSAALAAFAGLPGRATAATATTTSIDGRPTASPLEPDGRKGDYDILVQGELIYVVKCLEGGTVFVQTSELTGKDAQRRDAALRSACRSVDYAK